MESLVPIIRYSLLLLCQVGLLAPSRGAASQADILSCQISHEFNLSPFSYLELLNLLLSSGVSIDRRRYVRVGHLRRAPAVEPERD